jgi:hypothetical protein
MYVRFRKTGECSVAVIKTAEYKCGDETFGDFFADGTTVFDAFASAETSNC